MQIDYPQLGVTFTSCSAVIQASPLASNISTSEILAVIAEAPESTETSTQYYYYYYSYSWSYYSTYYYRYSYYGCKLLQGGHLSLITLCE